MFPVRRYLVALACAGALASAAPAWAQTAPTSLDAEAAAVAASPRVQGAQQRIAAAQASVDAASAALAEVRARMTRATPDEVQALGDQEAERESEKDLRIAALTRATDSAARIAAEERAAVAPDDDPASLARADSTTGVVLAPAAAAKAAEAPVASPAPGAVTGTPAAVPVVGTGSPDAATIDAFLASKGSPMTGLGAVFVAEGHAVGLDPRMLVAIAGAETSFGTYGPSQGIHNPFGLGPGMQFPAWSDAIRYAARNLAGPLYFGRGHVTIAAIHAVWAPIGATNDPGGLNSHWTHNVGMYYAQQGGDPNAPVFTGAPAPATEAAPVFAPSQGLAAATTVTNAGPPAAAAALEALGTPHPAQQPRGGMDDIALVRTVYAAQGVTLPARPNALGLEGEPVRPQELRAGDVLLFGSAETGNSVVHVGMYVGGGVFVHAPGAGDVVRLASLYDTLWATSYLGARRI